MSAADTPRRNHIKAALEELCERMRHPWLDLDAASRLVLAGVCMAIADRLSGLVAADVGVPMVIDQEVRVQFAGRMILGSVFAAELVGISGSLVEECVQWALTIDLPAEEIAGCAKSTADIRADESRAT